MEIIVQPRTGTAEIEMDVIVPASDFAVFINKTISVLSKNVHIKGFRPGKAPKELAVTEIGQDHILQDAMNEALPYFFAHAAVEKDIQAVNRPAISIHEIGMDTPLHFTAVVEVIPEIQLADPKTLQATKKDISATDEQVDQELKRIARMRSVLEDVQREAKKDDVVTIDFTVRIDGAVIEGGESKNHPITLGEGRFIPGFEEALLGKKAGEDVVFPITFPEDYSKKDIAGKKAEVTAHIHTVQERIIPTVDDVFAESVGKFKTLQELKDQLKKNITDEATTKEEERYLGELAEQLTEKSTFGIIPPSLIEHEIDRRLEEFSQMLAYQQKTLEEYMIEHDSSIQKMRDSMKESAEKHVKIGLALREFAKKHDITLTKEEITEEANKQLAHFASVEHAHDEIDPHELQDYVESVLKNKKTLELLGSLASK
ncbi:MAG TPA: trigger factor [Candidatus Andersenbacteria bacterium]|nr:trigger factor [Candidatus Andersenbacteria bacterium]